MRAARSPATWRLVVGAFAALGAACTSDTAGPVDAGSIADATGDVHQDGTAPFDAGSDSSTDAPAGDAGADGAQGPTVYNDMTSAGNWSVFDLRNVPGVSRGTLFTTYAGATFDGRYLYLAPFDLSNGVADGAHAVLRLDTFGSFADVTSWSTFDVATVNSFAAGFTGAAFDGRYVYLVPSNAGQGTPVVVARYDTQAYFDAPSAWSTFDVTTLSSIAGGYLGATFDGRYLYFVPYFLVREDGGVNPGPSGLVTRYDTSAPFTSASSWSIFDTASLSPSAAGFIGGVYDGRFVYLVPDHLVSVDGGAPAHFIARYDTLATFDSAASWSSFDTTQATTDLALEGFATGAFDGRNVYLAPLNNGTVDGKVARYDTHTAFAAPGGWTEFDTTTVNPLAAGFAGAAFDGRFVYFVPANNGAPDGIVARCDTGASFSNHASWSTFDTAGLDPNAGGFAGGAFDGRYLYLVPATGSVMARFDAKSPPSMPDLYGDAGPPFSGSFF